jgi:hypothetical protein
MGAAFALASGSPDLAHASAIAVRAGMRWTFALAALLIVAAFAIGTREES